MHFDSRIPVFWAANLLLFFLTMLVNSRLAPYSLYLILLGPMLVLPALYLKFPSFLLLCFITGLSVDALLPQIYWLFTYSFPLVGLFIRLIRSHFRTETTYHFTLLAHIPNLACIVLIFTSQAIYLGQFYDSLIQLGCITLLSHLLLYVVANWFFSFERLLLELLNMEHAYQDEFLEL